MNRREIEVDALFDELFAEWLQQPDLDGDYARRCPECGAASEHGEMCNECVSRMFPGMF
jgi:hypothetical protein